MRLRRNSDNFSNWTLRVKQLNGIVQDPSWLTTIKLAHYN